MHTKEIGRVVVDTPRELTSVKPGGVVPDHSARIVHHLELQSCIQQREWRTRKVRELTSVGETHTARLNTDVTLA